MKSSAKDAEQCNKSIRPQNSVNVENGSLKVYLNEMCQQKYLLRFNNQIYLKVSAENEILKKEISKKRVLNFVFEKTNFREHSIRSIDR